MRRILSFLICFLLVLEQSGFAQVSGQMDIAGVVGIGHIIAVDKFRPVHLRSLRYDAARNDFRLLLDKGDAKELQAVKLEDSTKTLLNYFFIGLSLPNSSFWVNLRPDGQDNIIDNDLAKTDIGRIMLETDVQLKKDLARFTSPQTREGKQYWDKLYKRAEELFGSDAITIPTLTRPWIVPDEIIIRETLDSAYIYKATLKVMLEQDYLKNGDGSPKREPSPFSTRLNQLNAYSTQLIRELIIPNLTKEVNISKRYSALRQVYYSFILAQWFKARAIGKTGKYAQIIDQRDLTTLTSKESWSKTRYFNEYQKSFKDGEYNLTETVPTVSGQVIRSYSSGGMQLNFTMPAVGALPDGGTHAIRITCAPAASGELLSNSYTAQVHVGAEGFVQVAQPMTDGGLATKVPVLSQKGAGAADSINTLFKKTYTQEDLASLYWGVVSQYVKEPLEKIKNGEKVSYETIKDTAHKAITKLYDMLRKEASEKGVGGNESLTQARNKIEEEIANGSEQQSFAVAVAAFIGEQAKANGNGEYINIYFPRDMALCFPVDATLNVINGKEPHAGLYHLSRASFNYYGWMSSAIDTAAGQAGTIEDFFTKLQDAIAEKKKDPKFKEAIDKIEQELDGLGYKELNELGQGKAKVRFVDTGYKTFPLMMQAIFHMHYPNIETKGLVMSSHLTKFLPQLNKQEWRKKVVAEINEIPTVAKYVTSSWGIMENAEGTFRHPFEYKETSQAMEPTSAGDHLLSFWYEIVFVMGAITYNNLLNGITDDLKNQGKEEEEAKAIAHEAVKDALDIVDVKDDKTGTDTAVMVTKEGAKERDMVGAVEAGIKEKVPGFEFSTETKKSLDDLVRNKQKADNVLIQKAAQAKRIKDKENKGPRSGLTTTNLLLVSALVTVYNACFLSIAVAQSSLGLFVTAFAVEIYAFAIALIIKFFSGTHGGSAGTPVTPPNVPAIPATPVTPAPEVKEQPVNPPAASAQDAAANAENKKVATEDKETVGKQPSLWIGSIKTLSNAIFTLVGLPALPFIAANDEGLYGDTLDKTFDSWFGPFGLLVKRKPATAAKDSEPATPGVDQAEVEGQKRPRESQINLLQKKYNEIRLRYEKGRVKMQEDMYYVGYDHVLPYGPSANFFGLMDTKEIPYEPVSGQIGRDFDAHGISKSGQLTALLNLLQNGIDTQRTFHTLFFELPKELKGFGAGIGTADGTAYKDGIVVVTSGYKQSLANDGIKHVFINDVCGELKGLLQQIFPKYQFHLLSEQKIILETEAANAAKSPSISSPGTPQQVSPAAVQPPDQVDGQGRIRMQDGGDVALQEVEKPERRVSPEDILQRVADKMEQVVAKLKSKNNYRVFIPIIINDETPLVSITETGRDDYYGDVSIKILRFVLEEEGLSDGEITFILGHEVGHAVKRHTDALYHIDFNSASDTREKNLAYASRQMELEADRLGYHIMVESGYNPEEAISALIKSKSLLEKARRLGLLIKDSEINRVARHPTDDERINQLRKLISEEVIYQSHGAPQQVSSAAAQDGGRAEDVVKQPGGIDFRSLPIVTQAVANLSVGMRGLATENLKTVNLDREWTKIEKMLTAGMSPSAERIKEYVQGACVQDTVGEEKDKIISCISDVLRLEEERCCATDPVMRDMLVVLEARKTVKELKEVFIGG